MAREPKDFTALDTALEGVKVTVEALKAADGADVRADEALERASVEKAATDEALTNADTAAEQAVSTLLSELKNVGIDHVDEE